VRPDIRPQLREFLAGYEEVLGRIEAGAVVAPGEQERLTEALSPVIADRDEPSAMRSLRLVAPGEVRPDGIFALAGARVTGTGRMSRVEVEQESWCVQDAASRSAPLIPNVRHWVPRRRFRTIGAWKEATWA